MRELLVNQEMKTQESLMASDEAYYMARNFEFDFKKTLSNKNYDEFFNYWKTKGNLTYGYYTDLTENHCIQSKKTFKNFMKSTTSCKDDYCLFSPEGLKKTCVVLEINYENFKTYGIITSQVCIKHSSPLLSC